MTEEQNAHLNEQNRRLQEALKAAQDEQLRDREKLHQLEETEEIPQLFSMIVRQFRLLVQTRSILDHGGRQDDVRSELGQIPFVAEKLCRQASAFTAVKLRTIYSQLLEFDYQFKTSQSDPEAALDLFILDVAQLLRKK